MVRLPVGKRSRVFQCAILFSTCLAVALLVASYHHLLSSPRKEKKFWSGFKPLGLPRNRRAEPDAECPPRRIFIDAGARLGDTLDFFKQSKNQFPQPQASSWEVFAFEIVPSNSHYAQVSDDMPHGLHYVLN
jgi:hypothetical protein